MTWLAIAWIAGAIVALGSLYIVARSRLFPLWKAIVAVAMLGCVACFVLPQRSPLLVFFSLAAFYLAVRPLRARDPSAPATLVSFAAVVAAVAAANVYFADGGGGYTGNLVADIRTNVARRWESIVEESARITESLGVSVRSAAKAAKPAPPPGRSVRKRLDRVRELLLPVDCRDILSAVDELDGRIAAMQKEIVRAEGGRVRHPDQAAKYDARIEDVKARVAQLEQARSEQAAKVLENLRAIGFSLQGSAAERCVFPVNVESLVDVAVVAKDIAVVVENLRGFLNSGDLETAKRYFGMYLVMLDVQAECYRQYLEKSEHGEWRRGINGILRDAEAAVRSDEAHAAQPRFKDSERAIFRHNAEVNRRTVEAGRAYLDLLGQYEGIIREKLREAERIREVAQSSWNTVNLASELSEIVRASQDEFQALLAFELPPLALFDDAALQAEFDAITRKLRKE